MVETAALRAIRTAYRALLGDAPPAALISEVCAALTSAGLGPFAVVVPAPATHAWPLDPAAPALGALTLAATAPLAPAMDTWLADLARDLGTRVRGRGDAAPPDPLELLARGLDATSERVFLMEAGSPRFIYVNAAAAASLGYTRRELVGMTIFDIDPAVDAAAWAERASALRRTRHAQRESRQRTRDGRLIPVHLTVDVFEVDGRSYSLAVARDVTAERAAADRLIASEAAYRTLIDNTPDIVLRWSRDLAREFVSPSFARALGRTPEELLGHRFGTDHLGRMSARLGTIEHAIQRVFATGEGELLEVSLETVAGPRTVQLRLAPELGADGSIGTVVGIGRDITELKEIEADLRSLAENAPDVILRLARDGTRRFANRAGLRLAADEPALHAQLGQLVEAELATLDDRHREVTVTLAGADGPREIELRLVPEPRGTVLVIARDVSAQRRLEQQYRHAQKMEAVGRLAGGVAHDFNNLLAVIQLQVSMLETETDGAEIAVGLREIGDAAERAAALTRQLLAFSRRQVSRPVDLDLRDSLTGMARLLRRVLGEDVTLVTQLDAAPAIHIDPTMVEQVVMNLAVNARDAMPRGGTLSLLLDTVTRPGRDGASQAYARLRVTDTGLGIAPEHLARIFEPFFTTKEVGKGTGLGLAMVYAIVEQHHGRVEVESVVGVGTTFHVLWPAADHPAAPRPAAGARVAPTGTATLLLVEDDDPVRHQTRQALTRLGYRVLEAASPAQALPLWRAHRAAVDLVVTDVVMPGMSGPQLVALLRRDEPGLRVLFVSGYSPDPLTGDEPRSRLLAKPFTVDALAVAVRDALAT